MAENDRRLLAVFAHPDDESFGAGGTLALYARRGVEVHLVCATRGEAGEAPADCKGFPTVGAMRESELRCAAEILGLAGVHFLGYRDSGMAGSPENRDPRAWASVPPAEAGEAVARFMRSLRPQVVITFDPIGGYRHPDHIAAHRATVEAFRRTTGEDGGAGAPQKLYFHTMPRGALRWAARILPWFGQDPRRFGKNRDIDLAALVGVEYPVHAKIDIHSVLDVKQKASACHASQDGGRMGPLQRGLALLAGGSDTYMRAFPLPPPDHVERDLFEGVDERR
jgi:N-acetyl-1-D-myo-inositol-2-amino-2-deoxy-alpha-D-glucopyranoside deacetylase